MCEVEIRHDAEGKPCLAVYSGGKWVPKTRIKFSITHAGGMAAAACVMQAAGLGLSQVPSERVDSRARLFAWAAIGLGLMNIVFWLILLAHHK
jgi:hypothetical protein